MIKYDWRKSINIDYKNLYKKIDNKEITMKEAAEIQKIHITTAYRRYEQYKITHKTYELVYTNEDKEKANNEFNKHYEKVINTCYKYLEACKRYNIDFEEFISTATEFFYKACLKATKRPFTAKYTEYVKYAFYHERRKKYRQIKTVNYIENKINRRDKNNGEI